MRLTHYDKRKKRWQVNIDYGAVMVDELNYAVGEAIDKLAAYEDTGYSPLEIKSLEGEWNATRAKVGDTVTVTDPVREPNKPKWIPVTELLPEESEGLKWHEDMMIRFTSVWCCDAKNGIVGERYRLQEKVTVNGYSVQRPNWEWSKAWWEPTHWMPIAPPTELPKEEKI